MKKDFELINSAAEKESRPRKRAVECYSGLKYIPHMENIKNTAELLHLPTNFIREKVLTGEIVAVRAGRRYLVNVDKLIEYLNTHTIDPGIEPDEETDNYGIHPVRRSW